MDVARASVWAHEAGQDRVPDPLVGCCWIPIRNRHDVFRDLVIVAERVTTRTLRDRQFRFDQSPCGVGETSVGDVMFSGRRFNVSVFQTMS
ncbi:hypothetical protein C7T36_10640 [Rhodococcus sp. AD45-ID]|nr:hypothetical protein C7T36_10640 [Rhodococcus sp. AD45-ID]